MAFTQTDLNAVDAAIASGEMTVEVDGRRVTYRSIEELERAKKIIQEALAPATSKGGVRRGSYQVRFGTARGF
jgi:hypothetical protein